MKKAFAEAVTALEKGEISLSDYFYELSFYYQSADKILEMEFNLNEATAELNKYNF